MCIGVNVEHVEKVLRAQLETLFRNKKNEHQSLGVQEEWESLLNGQRVSVWGDDSIWGIDTLGYG